MNLLLTIIALLSLSTTSVGQITWDQQTADTARGFETNLEISTENNVTFKKAGFYRWVRSYDSSCNALTMGIVDKVSCGLETTDSMDFYVEANETFTMTCYFYPNKTCCSEKAVVNVKVFKVDEPTITSTATYVLDLWCKALSVQEINNELIEVAPNPASNTIHILNAGLIEQVVIYNAIGEAVVNESNSNSHVDISGLKSGIYWISVRSEGITSTKKFVKV